MQGFGEILAACRLFKDVSPPPVDPEKTRTARRGERVMRAGDRCEEILVVLSGRLGLVFDRGWGEERVLEEIGPGDMAGDVELLNGERCIVDVKALDDCTLLPVARPEFERILLAHPQNWEAISHQARSRSCRLLITRHLCELFGIGDMTFTDPSIRARAEQEWLAFENDILARLVEESEWVTLQRGEFLFRRGDRPDGAYMLVSGSLRVSVNDGEGGEKPIARIRQGEILGEMALITEDDRSASISALRDCELFRLPAELFALVSEQYPRNVLNVYRTITRRFRKSIAGKTYREKTENIAFLPAAENQDFERFIALFMAELARYDTVDRLSSDRVDRRLGREGIANSQAHEPANLRLVQWLNGHELEIGHLVYQGEPGWSEWNGRCLRQADRVVIVTGAGSVEGLAALRDKLGGSCSSWSLVVIHPPDTLLPRNTARLLDEAGARDVFHVRRDNLGDMARLARILSGRAVGLVLGGGGARGFAHLGVLRALEETGINVDMIGSASIGSPIAGWLAKGKNASECLELAKPAFESLIDVTLPRTALLAGKRISDMITRQADGLDIEDFWIPFFCVSTNLTSSTVEVHRRGSVALAVRASVSIPGVLPPVPRNGDILVDGGVLNNLPIDVMREMNPSGLVLAIDVVLPRSFEAEEDFGTAVSGWRHLLSRVVPGVSGPRAPGLANVIVQSMMVGSSQAREMMLKQGQADFYQNIHVHDVGILQFESVDEAQKIGYESSKGPLRDWLESLPEITRLAAESRQKRP
jgi:predicted acylesterase/phospholipase RssA/CRP-like cAMP-binding protein